MLEPSSAIRLKRPIRLLDLTGFYVISALSLRWIATAAAVGPGAITLWLVAWAAFFVPLAACVLALSRSFPEEWGGFMMAVDHISQRLGYAALIPAIAALVAISNVGAASAFLTSTARLPFVAGLDAHFPAVFGRIHPKFGTPYVAVLSYRAAGILFALLSQAGTSVKGAYDVLVSMGVLTYFLPYVFLFAAVLRLDCLRRIWLRFLATIGLCTTVLTLVLSAIPAEGDPNKILTLWKTLGSTVVGVAVGMAVYGMSMKKKMVWDR